METIKIYRSVKKDLGIMLVSLLFTAVMLFMIISPNASEALRIIRIIAGWAGLILFGVGFLFYLILILRQVLFHRPFYIITDEAVKSLQPFRTFEIRFSDVNSFSIQPFKQNIFISIHYKENVEEFKYATAGKMGRFVRRYNIKAVHAQEVLNATGLSVTPEEFFNLLNDRLKNRTKNKQTEE